MYKRQVLSALRRQGFRKAVMLTGDSERTAAAIAAEVGVDEYHAEVLPEDKARYVREAKAAGSTVIMPVSYTHLILMVLVIPLSRVVLGTSIGTVATIIPLIVAAFPFVARLVEASLREIDKGLSLIHI